MSTSTSSTTPTPESCSVSPGLDEIPASPPDRAAMFLEADGANLRTSLFPQHRDERSVVGGCRRRQLSVVVDLGLPDQDEYVERNAGPEQRGERTELGNRLLRELDRGFAGRRQVLESRTRARGPRGFEL